MEVEKFVQVLDSDFYTGIPDSQLKELCNYLTKRYGINSSHHIVAANEGSSTALAAGYYLATGKTPVVYMQNSGEGNVINPVASLLNNKVYAIPCIFVIGWRGEPGVKDEPQHIFQGEITIELLKAMNIPYYILSEETSENDLEKQMKEFQKYLANGRQTAFVIRKGAFTYKDTVEYHNDYKMQREEAIQHIIDAAESDIVVCTTGKASRELFEIRERNNQSHENDFLTVGSMGHSSSIALSIAINKPDRRIWCIDGDGAAIMHMGALAVIGNIKPENFIHIIINNAAHESVGGIPTVADQMDWISLSKACGYKRAALAENYECLNEQLQILKKGKGLSLLEIKCEVGSRKNLGRPTVSTIDNKTAFMNALAK